MSERMRTLAFAALVAAAVPAAAIVQRMGLEMEPNGLDRRPVAQRMMGSHPTGEPQRPVQRMGLEMEPNG